MNATMLALALVAMIPIESGGSPAHSDSSTSTKTTGGDKLGAQCVTTVTTARTKAESRFTDAKSCSVKILGHAYKVWGSFTKVATKIPGSLSLSHATPVGDVGLSIGEGNYSIGLSKGFGITRYVLKKGAQLQVGPVPVYVEFNIAANVSVTPGVQKDPTQLRFSLTLSVGLSGSARATVGVSFAHVGVEGTYSPFSLNHTAAMTIRSASSTFDLTGNISWSYSLALVARAGWFNYSYPFMSGGGAYGKLQWLIYRRTLI
jgi:hypothetical protein